MKRINLTKKNKKLIDQKKENLLKRFNEELKKEGLEGFVIRRISLAHEKDLTGRHLRCCRPDEEPVSSDEFGNLIHVCRVC